MPRKNLVRLAFTVILPWLIWGLTLLACGLVILLPKASPKDHHEYQTTVHQQTRDRGGRDSEAYLVVDPRTVILTTRTQRDGVQQYQTVYADIVSTDGTSGQLQVKKIRLSDPEKMKQEGSSDDSFARLQYTLMPGAILNYEMLTGRMQDALCLYIYELNHLRCFGQ